MLDIEAFSHSERQNYRNFEKWPKSAKNTIFIVFICLVVKHLRLAKYLKFYLIYVDN